MLIQQKIVRSVSSPCTHQKDMTQRLATHDVELDIKSVRGCFRLHEATDVEKSTTSEPDMDVQEGALI